MTALARLHQVYDAISLDIPAETAKEFAAALYQVETELRYPRLIGESTTELKFSPEIEGLVRRTEATLIARCSECGAQGTEAHGVERIDRDEDGDEVRVEVRAFECGVCGYGPWEV